MLVQYGQLRIQRCSAGWAKQMVESGRAAKDWGTAAAGSAKIWRRTVDEVTARCLWRGRKETS